MTTTERKKSKSKSKRKNSTSTLSFEDEEKIDQIMKDITLKRPRNAYTQFVLHETENFKSKNKDAKIDLQGFSAQCAEKWKKLSNPDKKNILNYMKMKN